ncbi:MAG TPA: alpha/beta hydrolase [Xanthobacteraceae bacterium]|jgi:pimeloyl-ACP methyl ester carboxylesterase|nr:alpha/beta hydrolase [Xanthobacteraceae bacterium]
MGGFVAIATLLSGISVSVAQIATASTQQAEIIVPPSGPGVASNRAMVNGVRIHYLKAGSGPVIVLLHGWAETSSTWLDIIPKLAQNYTVIAPDLRGYGDSSHVMDNFDQRDVGADIQELLALEGIKQYVVVGHDLGAHIAFYMATKYPESVQKLVLLDSVVPGIPPWEALTKDARLWHWNFYSIPDLPEALIEGKENLYFSWFLRSFAVNGTAVERQIPRVVAEFTGVGAVRSALQLFRARELDAKLNAEWIKTNRLKMPVLALGGDGGTGTVLFQQMLQVADHVEGGLIKNCGHWLVIEQPEVVFNRLTTFLQARS